MYAIRSYYGWLLPVMFPIKALDLSAAGAIVDEELEKLGPMSRGETLTTILFVCTALFWVLRPQILNALPQVNMGGKSLSLAKVMSDSTVGMLALP